MIGFVLALAVASPWASLAAPIFVRVDTRALPHPDVRTLAQDAQGYLWIGTPGGLARFDGYDFQNFAPNPDDPKALPDGWIRSMIADPKGGLWIGTESSGLVHYDEATQTFRTWRARASGTAGPRSTIVLSIAQAADGTIWIAGDQGVDRFDPGRGTFAHVRLAFAGEREPIANEVRFDREGTVWISTASGLYDLPAGAAHFTRFPLTREGGNVEVGCSEEDAAGRTWVCGDDRVFVIDGARTRATMLLADRGDASTLWPGRQNDFVETVPGTMWIGSAAGGISSVDEASLRVRRFGSDRNNPGGLPIGPVQEFDRDRSGLIWIAKGTGGLVLFNPMSRGLYVLSATRPKLGLGEDGATSIAAQPDGRVWVGRLLGQLTALSPQRAAEVLQLPIASTLIDLQPGLNGTLWIGTFDGLCRLAAGSRVATCGAGPPQVGSERVDAVLDEPNTLSIGTRTGLVIQDKRTGAVRVIRNGPAPHALSNRWITSLLRDREGRLWIGTQAGLNRMDRDGTIAQFLFDPSSPNSMSPGVVDALMEDRRGRIWAGTIGGRLNVVESTPGGGTAIRHLGRGDGLPHENVDGLAEDASGRVWASTPKGIAMFEPDSFHARALGFADGVSESAYHAGSVSQAGDTIFFGGFDGVTVVAPGASSPWTYAPPITVTALQIGRKDVPAWNAGSAGPLQLPAGARDVSAEFAALDYSAPQLLDYQYKLDGFDRDWIETDAEHRSATYTNLAPGDYTLRVRATNRIGAWSGRELTIAIVAAPAWYETWWFKTLIALLLVFGAYLFYRGRTEYLRRRQRELESIVDLRTVELSRANAALEEMSITDPLTGLRNRRFLTQNLEEEAGLSLRMYAEWTKRPDGDPPKDADIIFFMIDIDHFKWVNDEYGHGAGDQVLIQMRDRMETVMRDSDFLVRWGGEEFLAIARRSARADAQDMAERMREAIASQPFTIEGNVAIPKTASIGAAAFPFVPDAPHALSWLQVIELADEALYTAKRAGRNAWIYVEAGEHAQADLAGPFSAATLLRGGDVRVLGGPTRPDAAQSKTSAKR